MLRFARSTIALLGFLNLGLGLLFTLGLGYMAFIAPGQASALALRAHARLDGANVITALRLTALALPLMVFVIDRIFRGLASIIDTVPTEAFTVENAARLRQIGWAVLATYALDLVWGLYMVRLLGPYAGWSPSLIGWLVGLMLFVLAEVWRQGATMRADLEGTV